MQYMYIKLHLFAVVVLAFREGCTERVRTCRNGNRPVNSPDYFPILFFIVPFVLLCFFIFYFPGKPLLFSSKKIRKTFETYSQYKRKRQYPHLNTIASLLTTVSMAQEIAV